MVAGWESALPKLRVGDQVTLTLAPEFGYGETGDSDDIPPNATLIFKVESGVRTAHYTPSTRRPAQVELVGIKDRTKGSGESDRERLAQLRAEREAAAEAAKAKKEALKAAGEDKKNALKEKLANKGKKGKGGGKKAKGAADAVAMVSSSQLRDAVLKADAKRPLFEAEELASSCIASARRASPPPPASPPPSRPASPTQSEPSEEQAPLDAVLAALQNALIQPTSERSESQSAK